MSRRTTKSVPVLPGLSRSTVCSSKSCARLAGHKGAHRASLHASAGTATKSPVRPDILKAIEDVEAILAALRAEAKLPVIDTEGGVEVLSFDRYTVQEPKAPRSVKPRRAARRPKVVQCRVSRDGVRCQRAYGHKQAGIRHSFAGAVKVLPTVGPKGRDVQTVKGKTSRRRGFTTSAKPSSRLA